MGSAIMQEQMQVPAHASFQILNIISCTTVVNRHHWARYLAIGVEQVARV